MINSNIRIGLIGFGNMGSAICDGLIRADAVDPRKMCACAKDFTKLKANAEKRNILAFETPAEVVDHSDLLIIAVKPYLVKEVLMPVREQLAGKAVVSIAAGCDFAFYEDFLVPGTNHISTIPNTPVSICEGILVCEETHSLTEEQLSAFKRIFSSIGVLEFIDSKHLSVGGTVAGCGPAFAAMFIEALGDAGVKYGLRRETAYRLAAQVLAGTGALQQVSGAHPGAMKDAVCSPGGTTIRGVGALEEAGFRNALIKAIDAIEG
ncbi:MAG: pyrroline-5-carboxylate reductase [Eubacterium sp.]|nr:pyrroline-5-carboxylate reductase [Eubacterium sp.]